MSVGTDPVRSGDLGDLLQSTDRGVLKALHKPHLPIARRSLDADLPFLPELSPHDESRCQGAEGLPLPQARRFP